MWKWESHQCFSVPMGQHASQAICLVSVFVLPFYEHSPAQGPQNEWLGRGQVETCCQALKMSMSWTSTLAAFQMLSKIWRTLLEWPAFNLAAGHLLFRLGHDAVSAFRYLFLRGNNGLFVYQAPNHTTYCWLVIVILFLGAKWMWTFIFDLSFFFCARENHRMFKVQHLTNKIKTICLFWESKLDSGSTKTQS